MELKTNKPLKLFEYLINTYSNKGDFVFDPFMGRRTTAVTCINTERNYLGFESDKLYFNKSTERIKNAV
jgi:site-specific DNA-methyltransferase (adenine-specific)